MILSAVSKTLENFESLRIFNLDDMESPVSHELSLNPVFDIDSGLQPLKSATAEPATGEVPQHVSLG